MAKREDAAKVPGAGKKDGTARRKRVTMPAGFGNITCKVPKEKFPELELDGVRAAFYPGWDRNGDCAGWCITISNPVAHALACADNALQIMLGDADTATLWDDLIPTHRRGKECTLQIGCAAATVRKYIAQLKREGFKVVSSGSKGGAR